MEWARTGIGRIQEVLEAVQGKEGSKPNVVSNRKIQRSQQCMSMFADKVNGTLM